MFQYTGFPKGYNCPAEDLPPPTGGNGETQSQQSTPTPTLISSNRRLRRMEVRVNIQRVWGRGKGRGEINKVIPVGALVLVLNDFFKTARERLSTSSKGWGGGRASPRGGRTDAGSSPAMSAGGYSRDIFVGYPDDCLSWRLLPRALLNDKGNYNHICTPHTHTRVCVW